MKQYVKQFWIFLVALMVGAALYTHAQAAVGLTYFRADNDNGRAKVSWATGYEDSIVGFRIRRGDAASPAITVLYNGNPTTLIATSPENAFGATYVVYDQNTTTGQTYTYRLFEVLSDSTEVELETATVTVSGTGGGGSTIPTNTPAATTAGATATPTQTPQPTSTTAAGSTAAPTATTAAGTTPTTAAAAPTSTPNARVTATPTTGAGTANTGSTGTTETTGTQNGGTGTTANSTPTTAAIPAVPVVEAAENEPPAQGYPEPAVLGTTGQQEQPAAPNAAEPTPYPEQPVPSTNTTNPETTNPPAGIGSGETPIPSIGTGANSNPAAFPTATAATPAASNSNTLLLWGGFLMAIFVFIAGVIGSILLFRRRQ